MTTQKELTDEEIRKIGLREWDRIRNEERKRARKELIEEFEKMIDEIKTIYINDELYDIELGHYIIKEEDIKQQLQKLNKLFEEGK